MDSKPTSWPRSRMESHLTKRSREKRKLQSSSPSSRNHPASIRHMKRFQKSTAIYTLPIRGKQHNDTTCGNGTLGIGKSIEKKLRLFDAKMWVIFISLNI